MKTSFYIFLIISFLSLSAYPQVPNDNWHHATNLGWLNGARINDNLYGLTVDTFFVGDNFNSLPNYPYYYMTGCNGYTGATAIVANDVWYKFRASNYFVLYVTEFSYFAPLPIDTLHLNLWIGNSNYGLHSLRCYTAPKLEWGYFKDTIHLEGVSAHDSIFMQVSGNKIGKFGEFIINLVGTPFQIFGVTTYSTAPTVLCMDYRIHKTKATAPDAQDGTAHVQVLAGNAPYTYLWDNGSTDSVRTGMGKGTYHVTITDAGGCAQHDSVQIVADSLLMHTAELHNDLTNSIICYPNPVNTLLTIQLQLSEPTYCTIVLSDMLGKMVLPIKEGTLTTGKLQVPVSDLPAGVYTLQTTTTKGNFNKRIIITK